MSEKRLTLSNENQKIAGVCGGIAEYFGLDVALVRGVWIFFTLLGGSGILLYLIAWLLMPRPGRS